MQSSTMQLKQEMPTGYINLGSIKSPFSFKGEAKVFLHNPNTELLGQWIEVFLLDTKDGVAQVGESLRIHMRSGAGKKIIAKIKKADGTRIDSDTALQPYLQKELLLAESSLPELEEDEFYHHQLLGVGVDDHNGVYCGVVEEIVPGTVDILVIRQPNTELLYVPFLQSKVLSVSLEKIVIQAYDT